MLVLIKLRQKKSFKYELIYREYQRYNEGLPRFIFLEYIGFIY
jgi:hypothetical protein